MQVGIQRVGEFREIYQFRQSTDQPILQCIAYHCCIFMHFGNVVGAIDKLVYGWSLLREDVKQKLSDI